jgi:hypothetical protein
VGRFDDLGLAALLRQVEIGARELVSVLEHSRSFRR